MDLPTVIEIHLLEQRKNRNYKGTGYIYQNQLDKACFQHNMA